MRFAPGWKMTLVVALLLPVLVALGFWQLERGALKRSLESSYLERLTRLPVAPGAEVLAEPFTRVRLRGSYGKQVFLLDNQVAAGRVGYWVVQVFVTDAQRYLVNRGFVPAPSSRDELPVIGAPQGTIEIVGAVWPFLGLVPLLDEDPWSDGWPKRVQRMNIERMARAADAAPVELRLENGQPGVFSAAPFAAVLSDARHRGYAVTWFGLSATLLIAYGAFGWRRARYTSKLN